MNSLDIFYLIIGIFVGLYIGNKKFQTTINDLIFKKKSGAQSPIVYLGQGSWSYHISKDCPQLEGIPQAIKLSDLDRVKFKPCVCVKRMYE